LNETNLAIVLLLFSYLYLKELDSAVVVLMDKQQLVLYQKMEEVPRVRVLVHS
jgi:hypothetical protein